MKKVDKIPEELLEFTDENLADEDFADNVNRLFPINDRAHVVASFEFLNNLSSGFPYKQIDKSDWLYLLDRTCRAAEKFEVDLEELLGGRNMPIDKNSKEFQEALAEELKPALDKLMAEFADKEKKSEATKEFQEKLNHANSEVADLKAKLEVALAEKEKAEQDFKSYQADVEAKARLRDRMELLKSYGMNLEGDQLKEVEEAVAEMSDKAFTVFAEYQKDQKKKMDEAQLKKMEEEKKKKDKTKASTDIVSESKSEGNLPNGEAKANETSALDKLFENMLKRR